MARTIWVHPETSKRIDRNKPPSWSKADYLDFLSTLHDDMDEVERAQREYDFQRYLSAKQADGRNPQESAQEFLARENRRVERKQASDDEVMRLSGVALE